MSWGEELRIETPEQIDFNLEVAGPGSRFYAQMIDWTFKWLVVLGLLILVAFATGLTAAGGGGEAGTYLFLAVAGALAFLFFLGYDIYYEGCCNGQTPGKRYAGIRVVRDGGGPIDVQAASIRNLVGLADFLPFFYLGGGLVALLNQRGQRLGDMAAGTIVIRERAMGVRDDIDPWILEYTGTEFVFGPEHLKDCTANDQHVLQSFFARVRGIDRERRERLAAALRDTFLERTRFEPATPIWEPDRTVAFLASLYRDLKTMRQHA